MFVLGIDTSNYRTSLCVIDEQYNVVQELNPLLPVQVGELGLQQSTAIFEHLKQWPKMLEQLPPQTHLQAIGVSVQPRPVAGSYMPVFKVGEVLAETLAHFLSVPLFRTSHQEGHIAAGEHSVQAELNDHFIAVHLSGGTSEVLECRRMSQGYTVRKLGGTLDLHAGQFVDRVGVALGLPFPAGPALEKLAQSSINEESLQGQLTLPSYCRGVDFSFSGPTSAAHRLIEKGCSPAAIARAVEKNISKTLEKSLLAAMDQLQVKDILLVGGVAANAFITTRLKQRLEHPAVGGQLFLANPKYATDNAYGVACLALKQLTQS